MCFFCWFSSSSSLFVCILFRRAMKPREKKGMEVATIDWRRILWFTLCCANIANSDYCAKPCDVKLWNCFCISMLVCVCVCVWAESTSILISFGANPTRPDLIKLRSDFGLFHFSIFLVCYTSEEWKDCFRTARHESDEEEKKLVSCTMDSFQWSTNKNRKINRQ